MDKRQNAVIDFILPGIGHWTSGEYTLLKAVLVWIVAIIVGMFTLSIGYWIIAFYMAYKTATA